MNSTKLSFNIIDTHSCKTLGIYDTSFYNSLQTIANATLQIISPYDSEPVELDYYKNAFITLNSNSLGITNVLDFDHLVELPDGLYTGKISICPEDKFWYEKSWYRTCLLDCKYDKAFLKLNLDTCNSCFSPEKIGKLENARIYIYGVKTNANQCNFKEADKLYKAANKILDNILNCDC